MRLPKNLDNLTIAKFINKCISKGYMAIPSILIDISEQGHLHHGIGASPLSEIEYEQNEIYFTSNLFQISTVLEDKDIIILFDTFGKKTIKVSQLNISSNSSKQEVLSQITDVKFFENQFIILLTKKDPWPVKKVSTKDLLELSIRVDGSVVSKKHLLKQRYYADSLAPQELDFFRKKEQLWYSQILSNGILLP